jgi:hypothetical protein
MLCQLRIERIEIHLFGFIRVRREFRTLAAGECLLRKDLVVIRGIVEQVACASRVPAVVEDASNRDHGGQLYGVERRVPDHLPFTFRSNERLDASPKYVLHRDLYRRLVRPVELAADFQEVFKPAPDKADGKQQSLPGIYPMRISEALVHTIKRYWTSPRDVIYPIWLADANGNVESFAAWSFTHEVTVAAAAPSTSDRVNPSRR